MSILFTIARILFCVIFVVSGAFKLMDIPGTTAMIAGKVTIPAALAELAAQAESAAGMQTPQLLAIASGAIEVIFGLLLAAGIATRLSALVLALFTVIATYYFHDFWNQTGTENMNNIAHAMKNLSVFAGLLVFFVLGPWRPVVVVDEFYPKRDASRDEHLREEPMPPR
jgi:putative oxidoreductase